MLFGLVIVIGVIRHIVDRSQGVLSNPLRKGSIVDAVYGIGTVTARRSYSIRPGVISTITRLYVQEGDFVQRGAKLALVDKVVYRAPFQGVVNYLPFKVGENIFAQSPMMVLTDLADRYVIVSLEQQGALRVRPKQQVKLSFDSIRNRSFSGLVETIYSYESKFLARIHVTSLSDEILPDMTADVAIIIRELNDVLLVPTAALENDFVWVKRNNRIAFQVRVVLGVVDGDMAEVVSGDLREGDRVLFRKKAGS